MSRSISPTLIKKIKLDFDDVILAVNEFRGQHTLSLKAENIRQVLEHMRNEDDLDFNYLIDLGGAHFPDRDRHFEVIYHLYSLRHKHFLRLRAQITDSPPHISTASDIWETADWLERETYDMYGIIFKGHKNLKRLYLEDSWTDFPLRKDYPLEGRD